MDRKLNGIEIISQFLLKIRDVIENSGINNLDEYEIFYRGESKNYGKTIPGIFRSDNDLKNEHRLFRELELRYPNVFDNAKSTIDKLAIMQHYGLPTRLLDFTTNPLLALYMAIDKDDLSDICPTIKIVFVKKDTIKYYDSDTVSVLSNFAKVKNDLEVDLNILADNNGKIEKSSRGMCKSTYTYLDNYSKIKALNIKQKNQAGKLICDNNASLHYLLHEIKGEKSYFKDMIWIEHLDKHVVFVKPKHNSQRLINQAGLFALFGLNDGKKENFSLEDFAANESDNVKIKQFSLHECVNDKKDLCITCTEDYIKSLKTALGILGITKDKVYPEMENASKYIKELFDK